MGNEMNAAEGATQNSVDDNELLYRCIVVNIEPQQSAQIIWDDNAKKYRLTSAAFKDPDNSVDIASKTTPQECLGRKPKSGAVAVLLAIEPKKLGYRVVEDPLQDNPAHALILSGGKPMKKAHKRILVKKCRWVIAPKGFDMLEPVI